MASLHSHQRVGRLRPGTLLAGLYRVTRRLRTGPLASTYLADGPEGTVLVQELAPPSEMEPGEVDRRAAALHRCVERLEGSPLRGLSRIKRCFAKDDKYFVVLERPEGHRLATLAGHRSQRFLREEVAEWALELCSFMRSLFDLSPRLAAAFEPTSIVIGPELETCLIADFSLFFESVSGDLFQRALRNFSDLLRLLATGDPTQDPGPDHADLAWVVARCRIVGRTSVYRDFAELEEALREALAPDASAPEPPPRPPVRERVRPGLLEAVAETGADPAHRADRRARCRVDSAPTAPARGAHRPGGLCCSRLNTLGLPGGPANRSRSPGS